MQSNLHRIVGLISSVIALALVPALALAQSTSKPTEAATKGAAKSAPPATSAASPKPPPPILIKYLDSYATGLQLAGKQGKPLLVQYNSASCGWCTVKNKEIDADPYLADFVNRNFIPLLAGKDAAVLRDKFKPSGTPHTLILTSDGEKLIERVKGYTTPDAMFNILDRAVALNQLAARNPASFDLFITSTELSHTDEPAAMSAINSALELDAKCWPLVLHRAMLHYLADDYEAAIKDAAAAKALSPKSPLPPKLMGMFLLVAKRYALAVRELEVARKLTPRGDQEIVILMAGALTRIGKRTDALNILQQAGSRRYDSGFHYYDASIRAMAKVDHEQLERSLASNGRHYEFSRGVVRWTMAGIVASGGDKPSAVTYLQQAVSTRHPYYCTSKMAVSELNAMGAGVKPPAAPKPATSKPPAPAKADSKPSDD